MLFILGIREQQLKQKNSNKQRVKNTNCQKVNQLAI